MTTCPPHLLYIAPRHFFNAPKSNDLLRDVEGDVIQYDLGLTHPKTNLLCPRLLTIIPLLLNI